MVDGAKLQAKVFPKQCTCPFTVILLIPSAELEAAQTKRQSHLGHLEVVCKLVLCQILILSQGEGSVVLSQQYQAYSAWSYKHWMLGSTEVLHQEHVILAWSKFNMPLT